MRTKKLKVDACSATDEVVVDSKKDIVANEDPKSESQ